MNKFYRLDAEPTTKAFNMSSLAGLFDEFSETISGINQIVNPNKEEKESIEEAETRRINNIWKIFLVVAILLIVLLLIFSQTKNK